jgi:Uma2 family endonuclease
MAAKALVTVEKYLCTSFDGPDREFVDGDIVERNAGDKQHSRVQGRMVVLFSLCGKTTPLFCYPELRIKLSAARYRVPDVAVFSPSEPVEDVPSTPPLIAVEIVSPDDRHSDIIGKLEEYRAWGIPHVWLIDPRLRKIYVYTQAGLQAVESFQAAEIGASMPAGEIFV